jgi:N-methylhydantoinase A
MSLPPEDNPNHGGHYRVGIDVGGTHTDMVLYDSAGGAVRIEKLPSTPHNPSIAVLEGLQRFIAGGVAPGEIEFFAHGTTVTTNAMLELKGAPIGLLINRGMRGILEVQTQGRDGISSFDHYFQKPAPLVRPGFIHEIGGRMDYAGHAIEPLDESAIRAAALRLAGDGVRSFAICFLFSFMNPAHEARAAQIIRAAVPAAVISRSSAVLPRIREWPRLSTTLLNAYLAPVLARYTGDLADGLDGLGVVTKQRFLMQSNGGLSPFRRSTYRPSQQAAAALPGSAPVACSTSVPRAPAPIQVRPVTARGELRRPSPMPTWFQGRSIPIIF